MFFKVAEYAETIARQEKIITALQADVQKLRSKNSVLKKKIIEYEREVNYKNNLLNLFIEMLLPNIQDKDLLNLLDQVGIKGYVQYDIDRRAKDFTIKAQRIVGKVKTGFKKPLTFKNSYENYQEIDEKMITIWQAVTSREIIPLDDPKKKKRIDQNNAIFFTVGEDKLYKFETAKKFEKHKNYILLIGKILKISFDYRNRMEDIKLKVRDIIHDIRSCLTSGRAYQQRAINVFYHIISKFKVDSLIWQERIKLILENEKDIIVACEKIINEFTAITNILDITSSTVVNTINLSMTQQDWLSKTREEDKLKQLKVSLEEAVRWLDNAEKYLNSEIIIKKVLSTEKNNRTNQYRKIIEEVVDFLNPEKEDITVEIFEQNYDANYDYYAYIEPNILWQIMLNIITNSINAIKALKELHRQKGIALRDKYSIRINISENIEQKYLENIHEANSELLIHIVDEGIGFSQKRNIELQEIKKGKSVSPDDRYAGLYVKSNGEGLSIVYKYLKSRGKYNILSSGEEGGAIAMVALPLFKDRKK